MKTLNTLAGACALLGALTSACSGDSGVPEIAAPSAGKSAQITDPWGHELSVTLLPGSLVEPSGDAHYIVECDQRVLEMSRLQLPEQVSFLEVLEGSRLLAAAEITPGSLTLRAPNGSFVYSTGDELTDDAAFALTDPVALALVDERTILTFDALLEPTSAPSGEIGVARQGLRIRVQPGSCPGASCTNSVPPLMASCCCNVGQRCVSTLNSCACEAATTLTQASSSFAAGSARPQ